jgi:membrane associated rhomboid family serine protease
MNYSEKQYRQKLQLDKSHSGLLMIMAICLIAFVGFAFVKALWYFNYPDKKVALALFNKNVLGLFTLPADSNQLLNRPWTLLTAMFVHDNNDVWKVFPNMFWLWSFGYILQDLTGGKKIIILAYSLLPSLQQQMPYATLGAASCGVMAVAIVTTFVSPNYRLFSMIGGGIPLWVLTGLYLASVFITIPISDTGTLITHIAAAFAGLLFIFFLKRGYDGSEWMNNFFEWFNNLFNPDKPKKGRKLKDELFYRSSSEPYHKTPKLTQTRVDEILDKINQQGYTSLSEEEKEILKRASSEEL